MHLKHCKLEGDLVGKYQALCRIQGKQVTGGLIPGVGSTLSPLFLLLSVCQLLS